MIKPVFNFMLCFWQQLTELNPHLKPSRASHSRVSVQFKASLTTHLAPHLNQA